MEVGDWYYPVCLKKKKILNGIYGRHFNMNFNANLQKMLKFFN